MLTKCWDMDPDTRATFSELKSTLEDLQSTTEESPPVDLDYELQQQARGKQQHGLSCMWCVSVTCHSLNGHTVYTYTKFVHVSGPPNRIYTYSPLHSVFLPPSFVSTLLPAAAEVCLPIPLTEHWTALALDADTGSDSDSEVEAPATLTCWSDPDPQSTVPQGESEAYSVQTQHEQQ